MESMVISSNHLYLELMVTMVSGTLTLTSLSSRTGMYVHSNERDANRIIIAMHARFFPQMVS